MKSLVALITALSLVSPLAFAKTSSNKTTLKKKAPSTYNYDPDTFISDAHPSYMVKGFLFGTEYLHPNNFEIDVKSKTTGNVEKGLKSDSSEVPKQWGLTGGYKHIPRGGMGFDLNLSILKLEKRSEGTEDETRIHPSGNFIFSAPEYVYGALGLNTEFVLGTNENSTYSPRVGYQLGIGTAIGKNFNFEIFYKWINLGFETENALMEIRTTSTNARLLYVF